MGGGDPWQTPRLYGGESEPRAVLHRHQSAAKGKGAGLRKEAGGPGAVLWPEYSPPWKLPIVRQGAGGGSGGCWTFTTVIPSPASPSTPGAEAVLQRGPCTGTGSPGRRSAARQIPCATTGITVTVGGLHSLCGGLSCHRRGDDRPRGHRRTRPAAEAPGAASPPPGRRLQTFTRTLYQSYQDFYGQVGPAAQRMMKSGSS